MSPQEAEVVKLCITSMVDVFKSSDVDTDPSEIIQSLAAVACQVIRRNSPLPQESEE